MARLTEQDDLSDLGPTPADEPAAAATAEAPGPGEGYKMEAMALLDAIFSGDKEALKKLNELARLAQKHLGNGGGERRAEPLRPAGGVRV